MAKSLDAQFVKYSRDMKAALSSKVILTRFHKRHGKTITQQVIRKAHLGQGRHGDRYPKYSKEYAKLKAKHQGNVEGNWLRGWTTRSDGHMLRIRNFSWKVAYTNVLWLIWTAPDKRTGIYAEVHNEGLPIGRNGPRKKREFMHFEHAETADMIVRGMQGVMDELASEFSAGQTIV